MRETLFRSCPTCEASCGLKIEVDREAEAIVSIKGDPDDHRSRGYVCAKSQAFQHIHDDPERLRQPVKKVDGQWQPISWEQALSEVGEGLRGIRESYGKDAIAMYYGNPNGHNAATGLYTRLFIEMLSTERFFSAGSVDQQPKNLSCELLYGDAWLIPIPDIQHTDFFVCMGGNPLVSQGSLMSAPDAGAQLAGIRERGGQVRVIDPRYTETAAIADKHLFIRPGTDAYLLLAWVNTLFATGRVQLGRLADRVDNLDELRELAAPYTPENTAEITGVAAAKLHELIDSFAGAKAPVLYGRIGLCTQQFGTLCSWLVDVVNLLQGRLDARGGAMFPQAATEMPPKAEPEVNELGWGRFHTRVRKFPEYMNMMPASCMAEELAWDGEDRARALITVAGNPVLSVPGGGAIREAIKGLDLVVALDFYINETTSLADYILPSTTQLEHSNYDLLFQTTSVRNFARYSPAVLSPAPDARHQYQLMLEMAARANGMEAEALEELMLEGLIGEIVSRPGFDQVPPERIRDIGRDYEGPERILDILLRAGPHGAGFDGADGLSLEAVKLQEHGVDLGPLQPRLPGALKTPGQRIPLLHDLLRQDLKRLAADRDQAQSGDMLMIGRRHIRDMNSWLHNLTAYARGKNRCTLMIHPEDAQRLSLQQGGKAVVAANGARHEVDVELTENIMPGVVSLPHGFGHRYDDTGQSTARERLPGVSANDLVDTGPLDVPSGTSVVNGARVAISAA